MPLTIEIIPDPEESGFTARLRDIPAYGEGESEYEAIDDLKATHGCIETFGWKMRSTASRIQPYARSSST